MGTAWPKTVTIKTPICVGDLVTWDQGGGATPCPNLMVMSINEQAQTLSLAGIFIVNGKEVSCCCPNIQSRECIFDRKNSPDARKYL